MGPANIGVAAYNACVRVYYVHCICMKIVAIYTRLRQINHDTITKSSLLLLLYRRLFEWKIFMNQVQFMIISASNIS